ncbi:MAG: response regulator [Candidatus Nitrosopolaris sp.]
MQSVDGEPKLIMVVDDDFDIVALIKSGLQMHHSFNVFGFTDPRLALEHFDINTASYHLVISDMRMPQMNGFEFIKKVKKVKPQIKVFLMTAFEINDVEFRRVLPSTKIDEFIQKPVSLKKLNTLVMNHTMMELQDVATRDKARKRLRKL